ncbi:RNA polymerase sigma factor RpoE [Chitinispirillum alkaliphilum]|nr:RNA polymerase sigma factor RpoE [Chitinispirillum alkaliphilum]
MKEIEKEIIIKAQRGNTKAFRELYDFYAPTVWRLCYRSANGVQQAAEEIVQDVFIKVHKSLKTFNHKAAFSTWLYRITFNAAMQFHGKTALWRRNMLPFEENVMGEEHNDRLELQEQVKNILQPLSREERFLLTAREVEGFTYEDLSVISGESEGALRTKISRLKNTIRKRLLTLEKRTA